MSTIGREDVQKARQQLVEEQHRCLEAINRLGGAIAFADQLLAKFDEESADSESAEIEVSPV